MNYAWCLSQKDAEIKQNDKSTQEDPLIVLDLYHLSLNILWQTNSPPHLYLNAASIPALVALK
ncbi:hypothetical protein ACTXT7_003167 [Hymenolepis weldensis]